MNRTYFTTCTLAYVRVFFFYRIDGPHNKAVLAAVHAEMREHDEDCSLTTIRSKLPFLIADY